MRRKSYMWRLPPEIEARLGDSTYGRQRTIYEADHLLIVLHTPPTPERHERTAQVFLRKPDGTLLCNGLENGEIMLRKLIKNYREQFQKYDEAYQSATSTTDLFEILEPLAPINRAASHMADALQSARDLVRGDKLLIEMRDEGYEIARSFELLLADTRLSLEYRMARSAEAHAVKADESATAQHKLNVLAAMTFPILALAAVFGMNLIHGFESPSPILFWFVLVCGVVVGLMAKDWVTRS